MPQPFASISASLLARKGEAKPSQEPAFGSKPWQPPVVPAQQPQPRPPVAPLPSAAMAPAEAKVRLSEVDSVWPTLPPKPVHTVEVDGVAWEPTRPVQPATPVNPNTPIKTTIRLTHAQVRAVKLAALLLDRPQQEILTAGLLGRLEAIACSDLSACTCFKAVMEGLKAPDPLVEPPLAY
jgi:hypothetical protein